MEDRIRAAVERHGASLTSLKPLHGGACQENFKVELTHDGAPLTLALRSDAKTSLPGSIKRRAEFEVIRAATAVGVRTPGVRWLEPGLLRTDADAYFLDWVPGEAIGRRVVRNPELSAAREKLPVQLAQTLAKLHTVTPASTTLPLPVPSTTPAQKALDELRAMMNGMPGVYPAVHFALAWLSQRMPSETEVVLVHGDFRTGNFMVTPDGLAGVLDWEFAHFGSPYEDLSWISVRDWRFNRLDQPVGGFSTRAPFYAAYESASGRRVDEATVLWWEIVGNLRWALGSVHQGERYLSGEQTDLELIAIARRNVEMEFEALRLIRRGRLD
ncbi:MAG: phosphotransferase family protein [Myxococcaceae bacterium]|jgi:aminoglycoside phosphotransferase (APT) family kinase protein|nr:phosphotransferase family protein [Myxococcaceae bacterium]